MAKEVAVLATDGVVPFDLGIACDVFARARKPDGSAGYSVRVCGETCEVRSDLFDIRLKWGLESLASAETVIIPGLSDPASSLSPSTLQAINLAWRSGARIASICTGAFVLAAAGLLDGRRATTHWRNAKDLSERYPQVRVDRHVLYVDEGRILTSAGASAGLDMCLHLVGKDYGQAAAAQTARLVVAPLVREGGQAQFIPHEPPPASASLAPVLEWMLENIDRPLDHDIIAVHACLTPRTLARRFRDQMGTTPLQWLLIARIRRAQELLETTSSTINQIAADAGFESAVTFRTRFQRAVGLSPSTYRKRFNATAPTQSLRQR